MSEPQETQPEPVLTGPHNADQETEQVQQQVEDAEDPDGLPQIVRPALQRQGRHASVLLLLQEDGQWAGEGEPAPAGSPELPVRRRG